MGEREFRQPRRSDSVDVQPTRFVALQPDDPRRQLHNTKTIVQKAKLQQKPKQNDKSKKPADAQPKKSKAKLIAAIIFLAIALYVVVKQVFL